MKKIVLVLLMTVLASCNGLNSSYDLNKATPPPVQAPQKPTKCIVDFSKTCWPETVAKITACIEASSEGVFSFDKKFCTNGQKMLVDFRDPAAIFTRPFDVLHTPVDFRILPDSKNECFKISGTRSEFVITLSKTGEKVKFFSDEKSLQFNCLDGQNVKINNENFDGCAAKMGDEFVKQVPGIIFAPFVEKGVEAGWSFSFGGAEDEAPLFKCYH